MKAKKNCFVIMPFLPELHYFYLYFKGHIERYHNIICERSDEQVLTIPILEKIIDYIKKADVIIADCSERNPNVFYELGLAHALNKKVILITKDPIKDAPSDIKHYEFIHYNLDKHSEFLERLDNALRNIFVKDYDKLYSEAEKIFKEFKDSEKVEVTMTPKQAFVSLVIAAESTRDIPSLKDKVGLMEFLLPKIVQESYDAKIMKRMTNWLSEKEV